MIIQKYREKRTYKLIKKTKLRKKIKTIVIIDNLANIHIHIILNITLLFA